METSTRFRGTADGDKSLGDLVQDLSRQTSTLIRQEMREASRVVASLDRPVGEEGDASLGDLLPSDTAPPAEEVEVVLREQAVRETVAALPEREREVIKLRYGLNGDQHPQPLTTVGEKLGVSPERVRQIEERALAHLALRREMQALREAA